MFDIRAPSNDIASVKLPPVRPDVTAKIRLFEKVEGTRQEIEEVEIHSLASHPLPPSRHAPLIPVFPSPAPLIVIVALVHDATFPTATDEIVPASYDPTSVTDPVPDPTVTPSLKVPIVVPAVKHVNELSDAHSLASHDVAPAWPTPVAPCWPIPAPTNVTMMEPVAGVFDRMTCDTLAASNDAASVTEPTNMAVVMVKV
mmetsp:Transcript_55326/g.129478  ORF Transcript_55326/g.129478 Transcript_55326/m.129478 type:complete len:200 (+) Transcript_55326:2619-3218(+)